MPRAFSPPPSTALSLAGHYARKELAVNLSAMTDSYDKDNKFLILYLVHHAVASDTDTAQPGKLTLQQALSNGV